MITILLSAAGFLLLLSLVAVFSALALAHRTECLIARMKEEGAFPESKSVRQA